MSTSLVDAPRARHNKYIGQVDRVNGVIRHCKLLGFNGKKRIYPPAVVAKALPLYEGCPVNIDHIEPGARRSYRDRIGHIRGVGLESDGMYGDFHVNLAHPMAEQVFNDAENAPQNLGFSHDTRGSASNRGGQTVVDRIDRVLSVDLVANPASTASLFEAADNQEDSRPFAELRRAIRGRSEESPIFQQARLARLQEKYCEPDRHSPAADAARTALLEDLAGSADALAEDILDQGDPPVYVPPITASLMSRLRRFQ